mgnify:CR=1 FL=1
MNKSGAKYLTDKALEAIRRGDMLRPRDNVLVALSGGADSMSLLYFLMEQRERLALGSLFAAHINHGLRGGESERDEAFVREQCEKLDVPIFVHSADVRAEAGENGEGIEEAGRRVRYDFLSKKAMELQSCVATAHTLNDSIESLLLHIVRGSGLRGLCGIPPVRVIQSDRNQIRVIRPLIDCTRAEIEAYCAENAIKYAIDSTNSDTAYARNRIRALVLPVLKTINPDAESAFSRLMRHMREDAEYIEDMADKSLREAAMGDGYGGYDAAALAKLPPSLRARALVKAIRLEDETTSRGLTDRQISLMEEMLEAGGALTLSSELEFRVSQGRLLILNPAFYQKNTTGDDKIPLETGISYLFYGKIYRPTLITLEEFKKRQKVHKNLLKNSLNYDKISGSLILRSRQPGDAFRPAGRGVRKTLKKLLGEEKIPAYKRDLLPVICDAQGIVLVGGLGCDGRVAIDGSCRNVLVLENE